jgi:ABC-2 type transport system permease protein
MMSILSLIKVNLIVIFRNKSGLFWTLIMPSFIYVGLSVLPIKNLLGSDTYSSYLLPGVLALTIMQGGIYTLAYWTIDLRSRGIIKRLNVAPIKKTELVLSLLISRSLVMFLQAVLLTGIGVLFFHAEIRGPLLWVPALVFLGGFVFLPLGLLIASFADTYESAAPVTAALGLPFTFLGSVFYPVESLPHQLVVIGHYLPITYLADALRLVYLQNPTLSDLWWDLVWLVLWIIIISALAIWRFRLEDN